MRPLVLLSFLAVLAGATPAGGTADAPPSEGTFVRFEAELDGTYSLLVSNLTGVPLRITEVRFYRLRGLVVALAVDCPAEPLEIARCPTTLTRSDMPSTPAVLSYR